MRKKNQWVIHDIYSNKSRSFDIKIKRSFGHTKFHFSGLIKSGLTVLISVSIIYGVVQAGTITPPSGTPSAQFYTLSEIYNFIASSTTATEGGHNFNFSDSLAGTGHTLTEIYSTLASLIDPAKVLTGTTYLGRAGTYNVSNLSDAVVKLDITYGTSSTGTLVPSGGTATAADVCKDLTFFGANQTNWIRQNGSLNPTASTIMSGTTICGVNGTALASPTYGDNDAAKVLNTAANPGTYDPNTCSTTYDTFNLNTGTVKSGTVFGNSQIGDYPSATHPLSGGTGNDAATDNILFGKEAWTKAGSLLTGTIANCSLEGGNVCYANTGYWTATFGNDVFGSNGSLSFSIPNGYYSSKTCTAVDNNLSAENIKKNISLFGLTGTLYGDTDATKVCSNASAAGTLSVDAAKVLTTATYCGTTGTYNVTNLSNSVIKKGITWGDSLSATGIYSGYPGSGGGLAGLTQSNCTGDWHWFEDGNGDGDITDPEDGICVQGTAFPSASNISWNGDNYSSQRDNSYIAAYTCAGSFPGGYVSSYSGIDSSGNADNTWNDGDCALCQADCYDGQKDLPGQGGYVTPSEAEAGINGPLTPEVLKNWQGTRLPTSNDFFGFCGATDGDANNTTGDSLYYSNGASADTTIGKYGKNAGRGTSSEYMDLSNTQYEWLSEQHSGYGSARVAGGHACSCVTYSFVYNDYRFRAVFRP
jgi:hypothetical protein